MKIMEKEKLFKMSAAWSSNDTETMTPYIVAEEIVNNISENILKNPKSKFLDPSCGKGTMLIALYYKLLTYHNKQYIIDNMIYGMDEDQLQCMDAVFFLEKASGLKSKNIIQGDSLEYDWKMKFDVIIMNPPYQNSIKDKGGSDQQIYHKFVLKAIEMEPELICAITPSRWFIADNMKDYRKELLKDNKIKKIVDYPNSKECFKNVVIKGGVSYFVWDKNYNDFCDFYNLANNSIISHKFRNVSEYEIIIRNNESLDILEKVLKNVTNTFDEIISSQTPFGLQTNFFKYHPHKTEQEKDHIKIYTNSKLPNMWIKPELVTRNKNIIDKYKVIVTESYEGDYALNKPMRFINKPIIAKPGEVCSGSFIICGTFNSLKEAENCVSYIETKFFRFMVSLIKTTQHNSKHVFKFVPLLDFTDSWNDNLLKSKFKLTDVQQEYIEKTVKPMKSS